jgi:hypothetical protein
MTSPAAPALECDHILTALRRLEVMGTTEIDPVDPPGLAEIADALQEEVRSCDLWKENWRNRIFRIQLGGGKTIIGKQLVVGSQDRLRHQFAELNALHQLTIPGLRAPKPLALLPAKRVCLMELAPGESIERLLWKRDSGDNVLAACQLAGKILAQIHTQWTHIISPMPVEALCRDFAAAPWHLSSSEKRLLDAAFETLSSAEVRLGQIYYDYKAANLLFHNDQLYLVDPPDVPRQGILLWDFAIFRSSTRRHLWRFRVRRPFDARWRIVRQTLTAFELGYHSGFAKMYPKDALFPLAATFFELQRTAVLMTMQKGKVAMAQQKRSIARSKGLGNPLANRLSIPLLEMEKRWLFAQVGRALKIARGSD